MKHLEAYIVLAVLLCIGCSDRYSEDTGLKPTITPRYLKVSPSTLSFSANASAGKEVNVKAVDTPWKTENGIDWVSLSPESGKTTATITVKASENKDADISRTGIFYVKSDVSDWHFEQEISVSQAAAEPYINVSQSSVTMKGSACTETIGVSSNCIYTISNNRSWLKVTRRDNNIILNVTANESNQYRNAEVLLSYSWFASVIRVSQAPASINASTETLVFENAAGEATIAVASESVWSASTSDSWIDVSPEKGETGNSTLTISVSPNTSVDERTGFVVLSIGEDQRIQIPVKQHGIYIGTDKSALNFGASAENQSIQVKSNTSWQVSNLPSWISVDKTNGNGNAEIHVAAEDNPNTTGREGEFLISQPGLTVQAVVKVHQAGKTFDVATTMLQFGDKKETQSVTVTTDGSWRATTSADWITVSPQSAKGNATLNITVAENDNDGERSGSVVVMMGDASASIAVVQKGKYFIIDNSLLDFGSKGGKLDVSLTANTEWKARVESNADWLSASPQSGSTNAKVVITAADNPSVNDRSANVYFDAMGRNVNIRVTQKARYLTVDTSELLFYSKGGTSNVITISTDGEYAINSSDNWLTVNKSGNTFTVTATENKMQEARIGHIAISLTDLKQGSYTLTLTVTQLNNGGTFIRRDYDPDQNYDSNGSSVGNLTIVGFGNDTNYDANSQSGTKLSVVGYKSDASWDSSTSSSAKVSVTGYSSDSSLDSQVSTSRGFDKKTFANDDYWDD